MSKKTRNYIFWIRRSSDLDHTVPVIYSLIENGIDPRQISYFIQSPHYSTKFLAADPRIKFLSEKGVNVKKTSFFRLFNVLASMPYSEVKAFFDRILFRIYISLIFFKIQKDSLNVMDQSSTFENKYVVKRLKSKGISTIAISHGLSLFNGHRDSEEWKRIFPTHEVHPLDFNDLIIMPNKFSQSLLCKNLSRRKVKVLGSPRYCDEWLKLLEDIYKDSNINLLKNDEINVLFLLEKLENYGFEEKIDLHPEVLKTLTYLDSNPKVNLFIKPHPSMHPSQRKFYTDLKSPVFLSDKISTFELVSECDLIIGSDSSSLSDAILKEKNVLILSFCSVFLTILENYNLKGIINSYEEFVQELEELIENPGDKSFNNYDVKKFREENVGSGSVLKDYYYLLSNFQTNDS